MFYLEYCWEKMGKSPQRTLITMLHPTSSKHEQALWQPICIAMMQNVFFPYSECQIWPLSLSLLYLSALLQLIFTHWLYSASMHGSGKWHSRKVVLSQCLIGYDYQSSLLIDPCLCLLRLLENWDITFIIYRNVVASLRLKPNSW